jgi:hypothetical protein
MGVVIAIDGNTTHVWTALTQAIMYCDRQPAECRKTLVVPDSQHLDHMLGRLGFDEVLKVGTTNYHEINAIANEAAKARKAVCLMIGHRDAETRATELGLRLMDAYGDMFGNQEHQELRPLIDFGQTGRGHFLRQLWSDRTSVEPKNNGAYILVTNMDWLSGETALRFCESLTRMYCYPVVIYTTKSRQQGVMNTVGKHADVRVYPSFDQISELAEAMLVCRFHITTAGDYHALAAALEVPTLCLLTAYQNIYRYRIPTLVYHTADGIGFHPAEVLNDCDAVASYYDTIS